MKPVDMTTDQEDETDKNPFHPLSAVIFRRNVAQGG
jgi:hypothetical protein